MEIPRQKKTVRVAVTRPSVKKGAIRRPVQNRRAVASMRTGAARYYDESLVLCLKNKNSTDPNAEHPFLLRKLADGVWGVLSFEFLAPERNCVLVSAQVPVNPCK